LPKEGRQNKEDNRTKQKVESPGREMEKYLFSAEWQNLQGRITYF